MRQLNTRISWAVMKRLLSVCAFESTCASMSHRLVPSSKFPPFIAVQTIWIHARRPIILRLRTKWHVLCTYASHSRRYDWKDREPVSLSYSVRLVFVGRAQNDAALTPCTIPFFYDGIYHRDCIDIDGVEMCSPTVYTEDRSQLVECAPLQNDTYLVS